MSLISLIYVTGLASLISAHEPFPFLELGSPSKVTQAVARGGASVQAPENTESAIEFAVGEGGAWISADVRLTRDGRHVLLRDKGLERTTNGSGKLAEQTLEQVKRLDAGSNFARRFAGRTIPTLAETLSLAKGRINVLVDAHDVNPARIVEEIVGAGMERQVLVAAPAEVLRAIRRAPEGNRVGLLLEWEPESDSKLLDELSPAAVELETKHATAARCGPLHERGLRVMVRTKGGEDCAQAWDRAIEAGVDWVVTDRVEEVEARQILKRIGPGRVRVAHHRGASRYAPENTLPAYEKSIRLGADLVEFDVRTTRDGATVLLHDQSLNRTTNGRGPLRGADAIDVGRLDAGAWFGSAYAGTSVPTFDAFLDTVGDRAELYVDAKDIAPEALVKILRSHELIDRAIVYQGPDYLVRLRAIEPKLRRMPPLVKAEHLEPLAEMVAPYAFDTRWGLLSKPLIERCHARGTKVFSDAIGLNENETSYQRAIRDGIDVIQTDHPLRVLRAVKKLQGAAGPR